MTSNKWKKILKAVMKIASLLLGLAFIYCFFRGRFVWAGVFVIAAGISYAFRGLPFVAIFTLSGLMFILFAYERYISISILIVMSVMLIILVLDLILMVRLIASGKLRTLDKSKPEKAFELWRENEITYRLWNKLKHKVYG